MESIIDSALEAKMKKGYSPVEACGILMDCIEKLERELAEARKQRDTLAEALIKCRKYMNEEIDSLPFSVIDDALAVMKGGEA